MTNLSNLKARLEGLRKRDEGFTLIELLVVVIIIGILAAIAIPIYIGVQNSAKDSATASDLTNARTAIMARYTATGTFTAPTTTAATNTTNFGDYGWTGSVVDASSSAATATAYCLKSTSESTTVFYLTQGGKVTSTKPGTCS